MKRMPVDIEPFTSCANCVNGWVERPGTDAVYRYMMRCPCWIQHQRKIDEARQAVTPPQRTAATGDR